MLEGLDFARSLADDRDASRALRAALRVLQQYDPSVDPTAIRPMFPPAAHRLPARSVTENRRRLGDILDG